VSASTQNLAFNSLLFFYRYVLKKEFGNFSKRKLYFLVDNSLLVITETDWVEFGKREETKDE